MFLAQNRRTKEIWNLVPVARYYVDKYLPLDEARTLVEGFTRILSDRELRSDLFETYRFITVSEGVLSCELAGLIRGSLDTYIKEEEAK